MSYNTPQQPQPRRSATPVIAIAGAVSVVAVLGIVLVLMFGFGSSPSDTVQKYVDLQNEGKYVEMLDETTTTKYQENFQNEQWEGGTKPPDKWVEEVEGGSLQVEFKDESIDGDKATVTVDEIFDGNSNEIKLYMVWQDGKWLIDSTDQ